MFLVTKRKVFQKFQNQPCLMNICILVNLNLPPSLSLDNPTPLLFQNLPLIQSIFSPSFYLHFNMLYPPTLYFLPLLSYPVFFFSFLIVSYSSKILYNTIFVPTIQNLELTFAINCNWDFYNSLLVVKPIYKSFQVFKG